MESVGVAVAEGTIGHLEREANYFLCFRSNTNNFTTTIRQLRAVRIDIQAEVDAAIDRNEVIKETVKEWMTRADEFLAKATLLRDEVGTINRWFEGWCCFRFNLCSGQTTQASGLSDQAQADNSCNCKCFPRFSLGRRAKKGITNMEKIIAEGTAFGIDVSSPKPAQALKLVGTEDFSSFPSRVSTAEEIRKALLNDAINLVGVYGMPGIGKTTLVKEIAKQMKEKKQFQEVVVVVVSQNYSKLKIQGDIAEKLDLSLGEDNLSARADRLYERLNQDNKTTLVILDDVWERIELSEVGIPYKNNGKCCKVLFTTREQDVCGGMQANAKIKVGLLSEKDSWELFCKKCGTVAELPVARELLEECKCLPLAIITLGLALCGKDEEVCANAHRQLQKSIYEKMSPVDSSIKLSYDYLTKEQKVCFLFCCLFPEDHVIELDVLLSYVMGEELLKEVDSYEDASGQLYTILDKLVSSGLLLRDEDGDIRMHDVVRDMAISISKEEEGHIVKAGRNWSYWPDNMELSNCKRLSMMYNPIQHLPINPIEAPHLRALFLNDNDSLTELPSDFFAEMTSLMTLDLSRTAIESLPTSLCCLQNLRTLLLNRIYSLTNLSPIEKLVRLEVLSLIQLRYVERFPEEMGNLSNLKVLDLTRTSFIESIKPNLISKLRQLETFHWFELENLEETQLLREVASLRRLTSLRLRIRNPEVVCHREIPGHWENLTTFHISVGDYEKVRHRETLGRWENFTRFHISVGIDIVDFGFSRRRLSLYGTQLRVKEVANWVLVLLGRTNSLRLVNCHDFQSVTGLGVAKGMNHNLKSLRLYACREMECVINNTGLLESNENAFSNLEELRIQRMDAFVEICKGRNPLPTGLLSKLKMLYLDSCPVLLTAIPLKLIHNLLNLESLTIEQCENLLNVLEEEAAESSSNIVRISEPMVLPIFPNLKRVEIFHLPKIRYVFTMRVARNLLKLEKLEIQDCPEMEVIFKYEDGEGIEVNNTAILPRLLRLIVHEAPKLKSFTNRDLVMEFPFLNDLTVSKCGILEQLPFGTTSMPNLNKFRISHLPKIRYVFTMRVARNLLKLEELDIEDCPEMEVIFKYADGENIKSNDTTILPRLLQLTVRKAPKLKSFTNQNLLMEFPFLEGLMVSKCEILESLPFGTTSMPNLNIFVIRHIPKIRYVFTMRVARNLLKLENLYISHCSEMEVIFKYADGEDIKCDQEFKDTSILPRLKKLYVNYAPNLKSFTNQNLLMELPTLEYLTVLDCDILERLPFGTTSCPKLKKCVMEEELFVRKEWEDESVKAHLKYSLRDEVSIWEEEVDESMMLQF